MLPIDPEREAIGRSIAAVLMAKQIQQTGGIHPETILTEIGALAGFAAQLSIRKGIELQRRGSNGVLVEVVARNGDKYYFGDVLNWVVFENLNQAPYSIWAYVSDVVPQENRALLPDMVDIVSHAARTIGTARFGVPRLPPEHMPHTAPRLALDEGWRLTQRELKGAGRDPSEWPYDLASAAQWQMLTSRDRLALPLAAKIVMEAAIPISKVDPKTVPGA